MKSVQGAGGGDCGGGGGGGEARALQFREKERRAGARALSEQNVLSHVQDRSRPLS